MAFSGIGKLIKDLVTGTPADTDYFAFGNTDLKKVSFPNLKKALGIDALNSALTTIKTATGIGADIANGEGGNNLLQITHETLGRWTYYNANSGSIALPPGEVWGFAIQLGFGTIYMVIFISGTTGKIYHAVYNKSWSTWYQH